MNPAVLSQVMGKVEKNGLFNLGIATGLEKRELKK